MCGQRRLWNRVNQAVAIRQGKTREVLAYRVREHNKTSQIINKDENRKIENRRREKRQEGEFWRTWCTNIGKERKGCNCQRNTKRAEEEQIPVARAKYCMRVNTRTSTINQHNTRVRDACYGNASFFFALHGSSLEDLYTLLLPHPNTVSEKRFMKLLPYTKSHGRGIEINRNDAKQENGIATASGYWGIPPFWRRFVIYRCRGTLEDYTKHTPGTRYCDVLLQQFHLWYSKREKNRTRGARW